MKKIPFGVLAGTLAVFSLAGKVCLDRDAIFFSKKPLELKPLAASYEGRALKRSSLGFRNLVADLLWIKLLQRADHRPLSAESVSWEYAQLQAITALDPHFTKAYEFGAAYLSVFRRDKLGARLLLESWASRRPYYWRTHYLLGYHLYFELGEYEEASRRIMQASQMEGAPAFLSSLGIRLLSESGALWQALELALEMYPQFSDIEARFRLRNRIRSLRFALERARWESALADYRAQYGHEPGSLLALAPFLPGVGREISSLDDAVYEELAPLLHERFPFHYDAKSRSIVSIPSAEELGIDRAGIHRPQSG